jgi:hypothetical protein
MAGINRLEIAAVIRARRSGGCLISAAALLLTMLASCGCAETADMPVGWPEPTVWVPENVTLVRIPIRAFPASAYIRQGKLVDGYDNLMYKCYEIAFTYHGSLGDVKDYYERALAQRKFRMSPPGRFEIDQGVYVERYANEGEDTTVGVGYNERNRTVQLTIAKRIRQVSDDGKLEDVQAGRGNGDDDEPPD